MQNLTSKNLIAKTTWYH